MGQGQEQIAIAALRKRAEEGGWIMLQNIHLMQSWLPRLDRALEAVGREDPGFRCFLTSEPPTPRRAGRAPRWWEDSRRPV